jgi:hypothetical protein
MFERNVRDANESGFQKIIENYCGKKESIYEICLENDINKANYIKFGNACGSTTKMRSAIYV